MYFEKFYESAAVQDPDNPGNDLEQVEDDVLTSHDDEVDDAVYGFPGEEEDPIEEAYTAIYEAEYNFNMIYKAIGMYELNEASKGKIGDKLKGIKTKVDGIVAKAIEALKRLWERVKEAFYKFLSRINPITNVATTLYKTHTKKNKDFFKDGITMKVKEGGNGEILSLDRGISRNFADAFIKMPSSPDEASTFMDDGSDMNGSDIRSFTTTPTTITASDLEKYVAADFAKLIREAFVSIEKEYKSASKKLDEYKNAGEDKQNDGYLNWLCKASQKVVSFNYMRFVALMKCAFKTKSVIVAGMNAYIKNKKNSADANTNTNSDDNTIAGALTSGVAESFNFDFI